MIARLRHQPWAALFGYGLFVLAVIELVRDPSGTRWRDDLALALIYLLWDAVEGIKRRLDRVERS